ncbi:MAG: glycosyltransferase family 2 protein [Phycisphaerales bacterium]|nr:glycosyltransferase family 2 protein [Phycisphaerales bacterium]MCI0629075.1 glycosyltransferase family 2 protein [Phycisphaerales bacterium]MCI0675627.1 glycosyltransferase family 2 protein [Phycisphaerales bacterium]
MSSSTTPIELSIVAPAHNEQDNLGPLVAEIVDALALTRIGYEIIIVDDGSTDRTPSVLRSLLDEFPQLHAVGMAETPAGRGNGQSAAFHAGFRASRGRLIAMMDADCQNDPGDLIPMLKMMRATGADMVQGDRTECRCDGLVRRVSTWVGYAFRRTLLGDSIRDTGCSLRLLRREVALALPMEYRGMHRYIPVTARHLRFSVVEMSVNHRPRTAGNTKYGIWNRALPGLYDCLSVRWMLKRRRPVNFHPLNVVPDAPDAPEIVTVERSVPTIAQAALEPTGSSA